ncbi:PadR family transcriptional regulator [Ruegeria sp. P4]|nr:PadR family transcriptional regulator [Ruegeria sp. P4]
MTSTEFYEMPKSAAARIGRKRTAYAVLGFVMMGPKSGYDIKQAISRSTSFFWNESAGQIYPILRALEDEGLIERDMTSPTSTGKRQRQMYQITDRGQAALQNWIAGPNSDVIVRNELLLKMFFGASVAPQVIIKMLEDHRHSLQDRIAFFEEIIRQRQAEEAAGELANAAFMISTLDYGYRMASAAVDWCDATIASLKDL